jgi:small subunit ribosomal protein S20
MPHSKSAAKRVRQNEKNRVRNRSSKARLTTLEKALAAKLAANDAAGAQAAYRDVIAAYDKAAKHGVAHDNKVSRKKSRLQAAMKKALKA